MTGLRNVAVAAGGRGACHSGESAAGGLSPGYVCERSDSGVAPRVWSLGAGTAHRSASGALVSRLLMAMARALSAGRPVPGPFCQSARTPVPALTARASGLRHPVTTSPSVPSETSRPQGGPFESFRRCQLASPRPSQRRRHPCAGPVGRGLGRTR